MESFLQLYLYEDLKDLRDIPITELNIIQHSSGCACGETGTCRDSTKLCNCDVNLGKQFPGVDEGYLTEKKYLPIKRIQISGIPSGAAYIQV